MTLDEATKACILLRGKGIRRIDANNTLRNKFWLEVKEVSSEWVKYARHNDAVPGNTAGWPRQGGAYVAHLVTITSRQATDWVVIK